MPTKSRNAAKRAPRQVKEIGWRPEHADLFRLASALGEPPRRLKVWVHSAGYTFEAKFAHENGHTVVGVTRIRRDREGKLQIVEERISFRFAFRAGPQTKATA